jgi:hypothetical protein
VLMFASAIASQADVVVTDLTAFLAETGANSIATFDDVPADNNSGSKLVTVTSGGATITGLGPVRSELVLLDHSFWFGSAGSAPNFFGPTLNYNVSFPSEADAFGVLMACFGCDSVPNDAQIAWTLYSPTGSVVGLGSQIIDLTASSDGDPRFLGVISSVPFASVAITKTIAGTGTPGGDYVIDDFRYVSNVPEPSNVFILSAGTAVLFWVAQRKRARHF